MLRRPGCRRESAPSACKLTPNTGPHSPTNHGIIVNITQNAPGAQYYNVYINPNGCDGQPDQLRVGRPLRRAGLRQAAPPRSGRTPNGATWPLRSATSGGPAPCIGASIYDIDDLQVAEPRRPLLRAEPHAATARSPDDEAPPQCFSNCPPPAGLLSQENAPMALQYPPYTGGDVANENYCVISPNPGDAERAVRHGQGDPGCRAVLLPERLVPGPERAGRHLRVRGRAVQLDRDLPGPGQQLLRTS